MKCPIVDTRCFVYKKWGTSGQARHWCFSSCSGSWRPQRQQIWWLLSPRRKTMKMLLVSVLALCLVVTCHSRATTAPPPPMEDRVSQLEGILHGLSRQSMLQQFFLEERSVRGSRESVIGM
ncbi:hypothetical protein RRG08_000876 [Elysia crispata]|uniref:Uncharacterized protein n=1 Tax=Elysia crispata TaxID=231223 RepID=A0AAE1CY19_9GAST|nr:hypothetical protein RRG08_000876 [Elysia crispata]